MRNKTLVWYMIRPFHCYIAFHSFLSFLEKCADSTLHNVYKHQQQLQLLFGSVYSLLYDNVAAEISRNVIPFPTRRTT